MTVIIGIGLSSHASADEVAGLVTTVLHRHDLELADVGAIATRQRFVDDPRLQFGRPLVGFSDADLEQASQPPPRRVGIRARVAETAAQLAAAGTDAVCAVTPAERSAHVTVALACPPVAP